MYETREQLIEKLQCGEDSTIEFKELRIERGRVKAPNVESMAGECAAFANARGGVILVGVTDAGEVVGVPREHVAAVEQWIVNICENNCNPPVAADVLKVMLPAPDGKDRMVLKVDLPMSPFAHVTSGGVWYHRAGSTKRSLAPESLPL